MKKYIGLLLFLLISQKAISQYEISVDSAIIKKVDSLILISNELRYVTPDSAKKLTEYVLEYSKEHDYLQGIGRAYLSLGSIYNNMSDDVSSISYFKDAADIFDRLGDELYAGLIINNIAVILLEDEQYEECLEYLKKSSEIFRKLGREDLLITSYSGFGVVYIKTNRSLEEIMAFLNPAEELARSYQDTLQLVQLLNSKAIAHVNNNQDISFAISQFKEALMLIKLKQEEDYFTGFSYMGLGEAYMKEKKFRKAIVYNDTALQIFEKANYLKGLQEVYESRKDILEGLGEYERGFEAYKMLTLYNDSLYSKNRSKQLNGVRTEYETERKESEILALSQQAAIQSLEIKQKNQTILIGLVSILLVLVATYFVYKQRAIKRQQSQVELEQRFLLSQLNPHFIFNALSAIQNYMLKNSAETAGIYLTKFAKLMREILENSREEFITVESEVEMLKNYLDIHKLSLNGGFEYCIEVDESIGVEVDTIPPMFVQPFVENAIEHGISHAEGRGLIELNFNKEGEYISIEVKDNGGGVIARTDPKEHKSLASTIIKERMALFNKSLKDKIQLVIDEMKNDNGNVVGTRVELKVPFGYL